MRTTCSRCGAEYDGKSFHGPGWCTKRAGRRSTDVLEVPPSPDIATLETAAESLARLGDIPNAVAVWAVILRMREELKCPVT